MNNYPSMSYCMFENTCNALSQIHNAITEAIEGGESYSGFREDRSSREEAFAFDRLRKLCEEVLEAYQDLELQDEE